MLNISTNSISKHIQLEQYEAWKVLRRSRISKTTIALFSIILLIGAIGLFLPWTQNINGTGYVTTRSPEQRPQGIQSVIAGRIEKWYVKEGDFVNAGDTIVHISEIKSEYFDPELIERTTEQLDAKAQSVDSYQQKINALKTQYSALQEMLKLKRNQLENKIEQGYNKVEMDSIDLAAYRGNLEILENQLARTNELYEKGLKTLTEKQDKEYKVQQARAKVTVQENKLINQRNELTNSKLELLAIEKEYADKLSKSLSDQQSALSARLESQAATSKLRNQVSNYSERQKFYYILAPQSGFITKTTKKGIGETVKEGAEVATIMPDDYDIAVEVYLQPQDVPLLDIGTDVTLRFDGWPAIVISGWPESSTGVFSGEIVAIDRYLSDNGYYRVMITPHENTKKPWPEKLRVGTGTRAFMLLNNVPVWYELWRQLNGFPPDYYTVEKNNTSSGKEQKAPIRSIK